jgi:secondary thiamine-phosphate synthase enzyme
VQTDLIAALDQLAPESAPWVHASEGPDDMPAHVKTMLTGVNLAIPVAGGRMMLGTWQGIYLIEHRREGHRRRLALHYLGTRQSTG